MLPKTCATKPDSKYLPAAAHKPTMPSQAREKNAHTTITPNNWAKMFILPLHVTVNTTGHTKRLHVYCYTRTHDCI